MRWFEDPLAVWRDESERQSGHTAPCIAFVWQDSLDKFRTERNFGLEQPRNGTACFCVIRNLSQLVGVDAGNPCRRYEMDLRDRPTRLRMVFDCDHRDGGDLVRGETGLLQFGRQCHAETSGVRGPDEFLGVCAWSVFEPGAERIWGVVEGSAFSGDCAAACLQVAAPDGGGLACHVGWG